MTAFAWMAIPVGFFVAVIAVAHVAAPPAYRWTAHTISDLGAQRSPRAWIMRAGFVGYGMLLPSVLIFRHLHYAEWPLVAEGACLFVSGFLSAAPIDHSPRPYSEAAAAWHERLAMAAGVLFSLSILLHVLADPSPAMKRQHALYFVLVTAISVLFLLADRGRIPTPKGIVQRVLYAVSFAWLLTSVGRPTLPS